MIFNIKRKKDASPNGGASPERAVDSLREYAEACKACNEFNSMPWYKQIFYKVGA